MKIALLGSKHSISKEKPLIQSRFSDIDLIPIEYERYTDCVAILRERQHEFDGILFPGPYARNYAEKHLEPTCPWEHILYDKDCIAGTMLQVALKYGAGTTVSVDCISRNYMQPLFDLYDLPANSLNILYTQSNDIADFNYFGNLLNAHIYNYFHDKAQVCITGFSEIISELAKRDIPCIRWLPTEIGIISAMNKLYAKITNVQAKSNTAVLIMYIDTHVSSPDENDACEELLKDYEAANIAKSLAARLNSTLILRRDGAYMIYCDKSILEFETDNYQGLFFSNLTLRHTLLNFSVGIGLGETVKSATDNAYRAYSKSLELRDSVAYMAFNSLDMVGPIPIRQRVSIESTNSKDFAGILEKMGCGRENARKLATVIESNPSKRFTTKELANLTGISLRSITRTIQLLEDAGYCREAGRQIGASSGRPAKVLEFIIR